MKRFKQIDFVLQAFLIIAGLLACTILMDETFMYAYFIVGGYQFISMLVHELYGYRTEKGSERKKYHNIVYIIVLAMLLTPVVYITGIVFIPLLFLAPVMAIHYLHLCYRETFVYTKRPLALLR